MLIPNEVQLLTKPLVLVGVVAFEEKECVALSTSLMGVLRWCIELGSVDIIVEVGLLARFQACP